MCIICYDRGVIRIKYTFHKPNITGQCYADLVLSLRESVPEKKTKIVVQDTNITSRCSCPYVTDWQGRSVRLWVRRDVAFPVFARPGFFLFFFLSFLPVSKFEEELYYKSNDDLKLTIKPQLKEKDDNVYLNDIKN